MNQRGSSASNFTAAKLNAVDLVEAEIQRAQIKLESKGKDASEFLKWLISQGYCKVSETIYIKLSLPGKGRDV